MAEHVELVESFRKGVEAFANALLEPYVLQLKDAPPPRSKEVNDTVWKTVVLKGFEVAVLDSPLLQRLRYVRQLGVAHWVYPAATHSRLEHSIGALHQLQRVLEALNAPTEGSDQPGIPPEYVNVLRLAALCHDVGHGVMSHVSENAFRELDAMDDLRLGLSDYFSRAKIQPGEAIAYFMVGSDRFRELVDVAKNATRHHLPPNPVDLVQSAIVGRQIHSRLPLLQELISGPFDIDKLDYMTRDAYMAGVPVVTDIDRLVRKIRLVEVATANLPPEIARAIRNEHPSYFIQAIALSGARTLDELMIGRALLFDKIYRHQKVRACEAMVSQVLLSIALLCDRERLPLLPLYLADEELLRFERAPIERAMGRDLKDEEWKALGAAGEIATRLRNRELFVRAYAYAHKLPGDPFVNDPDHKRGLEALRRENGQAPKRQAMLDEICVLLREMRALGARFAPAIADDDLRRYVALDNPPAQNTAGEIARAYLVVHGNVLMRFRDDSADTSPWSSAYAMTRDLGYVFSARELAPAVFLAAEAYIRDRYAVRTPPSGLVYSKASPATVEALRKQLTALGFYKSRAPDLRAPTARLSRADIGTRVDGIVLKLGEFQGLVSENVEARAVRVTPDRVHAWLRQFQTDNDVDAALRLLEALRMVSRAEVQAAVRRLLSENPAYRSALFCPLGSPKDSSHKLTYFVHDLLDEFPDIEVSTLPDALAEKNNRPIVFVDDFLSSGTQSLTIMMQWLDKAKEAPLPDEHHVSPLSESARNEFVSRKLGFVFAAGTAEGRKFLEEGLAKQNIKPVIEVFLDAAQIPRAFDGAAVSYLPGQKETFKATCERVGEQLLVGYEGKTRSTDWIAHKKLGYGNNAYLIVFPYNVPTSTLTALWCAGTVDGFGWLPLVPRRPKV